MATDSLEQQALDRVARMYAGYDRRRQRTQEQPPADPVEPQPEPPEPSPAPEAEIRTMPSKPKGLLDALMEDKEQSMLMLLLVILMKDGADMNAVLALMYLLI